MINPRISAVWSTTKPIAPFSCTPRVQEVHTKPEVVHLTPGLLGLNVQLQFIRKKNIFAARLVKSGYKMGCTGMGSPSKILR